MTQVEDGLDIAFDWLLGLVLELHEDGLQLGRTLADLYFLSLGEIFEVLVSLLYLVVETLGLEDLLLKTIDLYHPFEHVAP